MLRIDNIHVQAFKTEILKGFTLQLPKGTTVGLTGRSGAGKTTLIRAVMGILNKDCILNSGSIMLDDVEITKLKAKQRRVLCGTTIGYIPQTPMTAFDPRLQIGSQMKETLHIRLGLNQADSLAQAFAALELVNLKDGARVMAATPAQLSGGMLQRVAMALLLAMKPKYILADEPTSALDIENRDLLLQLLKEQCSDAGILLISHDVEALHSLCKTVVVLDDGRAVEENTIEQLLKHPVHSWTRAFSQSYTKTKKTKYGKETWTWKELL